MRVCVCVDIFEEEEQEKKITNLLAPLDFDTSQSIEQKENTLKESEKPGNLGIKWSRAIK